MKAAPPLGSSVVGISISEPPGLLQRGLDDIHLLHAFVEAVRHILAAGGSIAYAGDLRPGGYTESLFELLRAYERRDRPTRERILNFLAWPAWMTLTAADRADRGRIATLVRVPAPAGAPPNLADEEERSPGERMWFSLALTDMRQQMTMNTTARIVIGGRTWGQLGLIPGVLEEVSLAIQAGIPVYPIGGFGGGGQLIVDLLNGNSPVECKVACQLENTRGYAELICAATRAGHDIGLEAAAAAIANAGWGGLRNGLSTTENKQLSSSDDTDEIIALVQRGLRRVS